ncbi:hypothetical protein EJ02DRAFT_206511 [Clathrospora elynae]|uniref:Uncharacterized protein n=1 Tax=Clathrospora elynae TaxID=706981 RepID=A0A6A5SMI0_9PLEO|nr:hypothetical protein EJ02DRAFT_206511 [Clathrospora elynae]
MYNLHRKLRSMKKPSMIRAIVRSCCYLMVASHWSCALARAPSPPPCPTPGLHTTHANILSRHKINYFPPISSVYDSHALIVDSLFRRRSESKMERASRSVC